MNTYVGRRGLEPRAPPSPGAPGVDRRRRRSNGCSVPL